MSMKNPMTPAGIEPATFQFVAQHLNHCATAVPHRKTIGHVFTKLEQIEGTTQKFFPSTLFFIVVHISAARRCE